MPITADVAIADAIKVNNCKCRQVIRPGFTACGSVFKSLSFPRAILGIT
jgi:hypothetical protein